MVNHFFEVADRGFLILKTAQDYKNISVIFMVFNFSHFDFSFSEACGKARKVFCFPPIDHNKILIRSQNLAEKHK